MSASDNDIIIVFEAEFGEVGLPDGFGQLVGLAEIVLDDLPLLPLEVEQGLVDDGVEHHSLGRNADALGELSLLLAQARLVLAVGIRALRGRLLIDLDVDLALRSDGLRCAPLLLTSCSRNRGGDSGLRG